MSSGDLPEVTYEIPTPEAPRPGQTIEGGIAEYPLYDLASLVADADLIVIATVVEIGDAVDQQNGTPVFSMVSFTTERVIRGTATVKSPQTFMVSQNGGTRRDGVTVKVSGSPLFAAQGRYLLFLKRFERPNGVFGVLGGAQGSFLVDSNELVHMDEDPMSSTPLMQSFDGRSLDDVVELVHSAR